MTYTIPLKHPLDDTGLAHRQAPAPSAPSLAPAVADLTRYHHSHFVRAEPGKGWVSYYFVAFTGYEPEPELPLTAYKDKTVTYEQCSELGRQYDAARIMWSKARLRLQAAPVLQEALPLWNAWRLANTELQRVFADFWHIADGRWRAQLLRLTDAERTARSTAERWDKVAEQLARLAADQVRAAGEDDELPLAEVAKELGLDVRAWHIDHISAYEPTHYRRDTPLVEVLTRQIAAQHERLREVAHLAGDRELA